MNIGTRVKTSRAAFPMVVVARHGSYLWLEAETGGQLQTVHSADVTEIPPPLSLHFAERGDGVIIKTIEYSEKVAEAIRKAGIEVAAP